MLFSVKTKCCGDVGSLVGRRADVYPAVEVHVVPAVAVQCGGSSGDLDREPGVACHSTGRLVLRGVL